MFTFNKNYNTKEEMYENILESANTLFKDVDYDITNLANAAALLNMHLKNINWVGFYLFNKDYLYLGPFVGLPACIKIKNGKGVCGTASKTKKTILVDDVHKFEGHIACDSNSNSEIVIPIIMNDKVYGILDIDSPIISNFDDIDRLYLEKFIEILKRHLNNTLQL